MEYNIWKHRIMGRTDITSRLTHLTKASESRSAFDNLIKILNDKCLYGSPTGYIVGNTPVVCFQDTPLLSLAENIIFENRLQKENGSKVRYEAIGIRVNKQHAYLKGTREVFYGETSELKSILPESEYWRIVNHDLNNWNNIIDWTHEREWRIKGDYSFRYDEIEVIVPSIKYYHEFINYCIENNKELLSQINGIICMDSVVK